jgi:OOP family OmpA-OmpF porin
MRSIGAIATAVLVVCGLISATQASAQGQFYLGASGGKNKIGSAITTGLITSGAVDGKDTGYKAFAGYQFSPYIGLEVAYLDLGEVSYSGDFEGIAVTDGKIELTGVNYSIIGSAPVTPSFTIFAKVGRFASDAKASDVFMGGPTSQKVSSSAESFGLGARYDIARNLGVRVEWEKLKINISDSSARFLSAGVVIKF